MPDLTVRLIERIEADSIAATDLWDFIGDRPSGSDGCETRRVYFADHAEPADLVFIPDDGRAGIAWGSDAVWTDASSIEDAVRRYCADEMIA